MIPSDKLFAYVKFITETQLQKITREGDFLLFHRGIEEMKESGLTVLGVYEMSPLREYAPNGILTHFKEEKTMNERFVNIFGIGKKRKGTIALCAVILLVGIVWAFVAYRASDAGTIDNITLLDAGNSYSLRDGKFIISYHNGKAKAVVPLNAGTNNQSYFNDKAVFIADPKTAVAYGGSAAETKVNVLISNDMGKTWNSYLVTSTGGKEYEESKFIGFTNANDGWLVLAGDVAMGHQENRIFQTSDGGKSWNEIGNSNQVYARVVTGAGFANDHIGLLSFRYDTDVNPVVYRTDDKGKTWTKCDLEIPDTYKATTDYATAGSAVFNGANGVLPVVLRHNEKNGNPTDTLVRYVSSDYGKTWAFNK